jgi:hypothetical protein
MRHGYDIPVLVNEYNSTALAARAHKLEPCEADDRDLPANTPGMQLQLRLTNSASLARTGQKNLADPFRLSPAAVHLLQDK